MNESWFDEYCKKEKKFFEKELLDNKIDITKIYYHFTEIIDLFLDQYPDQCQIIWKDEIPKVNKIHIPKVIDFIKDFYIKQGYDLKFIECVDQRYESDKGECYCIHSHSVKRKKQKIIR
jgi:hypothetical protein